MTKPSLKLLSAGMIVASIFLSGCEGKWEKMSDDELSMHSVECSMTDPGPAMAQVCANVERECKRRRENKIYAC